MKQSLEFSKERQIYPGRAYTPSQTTTAQGDVSWGWGHCRRKETSDGPLPGAQERRPGRSGCPPRSPGPHTARNARPTPKTESGLTVKHGNDCRHLRIAACFKNERWWKCGAGGGGGVTR